jgi:photosystem II stability/assembly factor-like uncharacterized protein
MLRRVRSRVLVLSLGCCLPLFFAAATQLAADSPIAEGDLLAPLRARCLGPAVMGGRISAVAVVDNRPATLYVGASSGGVWKTVNNGTTWMPVFDGERTASIGDVAVAPSNPDIVWVGTGESNPRNSVAWGDGVYKSTDAGKTWQHVGLKDTAHIGRIVIHPKNPDIVYIAALGHLWGPNKERGVFKTVDAGKTWELVKFINEDTGFIDLAMDPSDPETLYAAGYQVRRDAFCGGNPAVLTGPGSGLFKTTDGGKTWKAMTHGLPARPLGRCGFAISAKEPRIVYAVVQTDKSDASNRGQGPGTSGELDKGGIFRSEDRGETWAKVNDLCPRPFYYGQIRIDPADPQRIYVLGIELFISSDGGKSFRSDGARGVHPDHHALWINSHNPEHLVLGGDGGLHFSYDRGTTWEHVDNLPISQFYGIAVDERRPYRIFGGLQDNGVWFGPSTTHAKDGVTAADWQRLVGADGFHCQVDPTDPDTVYFETQWGHLRRLDLRSGKRKDIKPQPMGGEADYRFNWNAPLLLSPHNPRIVYFGGNHVFRSLDRGDHWDKISPDLTHGKPGKSDNLGHTLTALAESPRKPGLLYAGSDDGRVHVSRDGGASWSDVGSKLPGPSERTISRIEASRFAENTAYLAIDRHRNDDRAPYLFRTTDAGVTWESIAGDLPLESPVHVVREDLRNPSLLFAGTATGLFISLDTGKHWQRLRQGLPTAAVHDLAIHPREHELVIATHGRGLYVVDIAPLQELATSVLAEDVHLFDVGAALRFHDRESHAYSGARIFRAANPPAGATIWYYIRNDLQWPVRVTITDVRGEVVASLPETRAAGLHRVTWDLHLPPHSDSDDVRPAPAGDYVARIKIGNQVLMKKFRVEAEE